MQYRFTRQQRLLKTDEFSSVFSLRRTQANAFFQVWVQPNQLGRARLGLVVGKKVERRAVGRNFIKRTVRDLFRHEAARLQGLDLVVRAKRTFHRSEAQSARSALLKLLARFATCPAS
ncbi:ribonuclease P protein component [Chitinimonas taiwanensis]|uniref:Ribonuclease P protein component n=1 Tax=Chitinimonas taiwanensis DSM 18899 TaxID=1121279 RepID=A0A1K2H4J3_9NEIS|nr:ribonuclease P protein component [Chitinimonas taiwanensis]SFZ70795.1 ribonuclease P protein component [Chitinimonas taiwanensis DSM 18899]